MTTKTLLVLSGARSGKSRYAQQLAETSGARGTQNCGEKPPKGNGE